MDILRFADKYGPAKIIQVYQPSVNLKAVLVIDNLALGRALGGIRMAPDVSIEECFRLARTMTLKHAAADLPHGGGKVVVFGDPKIGCRYVTVERTFRRGLKVAVNWFFFCRGAPVCAPSVGGHTGPPLQKRPINGNSLSEPVGRESEAHPAIRIHLSDCSESCGQEFPASFQQRDGEEEILARNKGANILGICGSPNPIAEGGMGSIFPPYDY